MFLLHLLLFLVSVYLLYVSGGLVVKGLTRVARFLQWKEFVVAFFVMAAAGSLPNLLVGISSSLRGIPELSFGDITGGNVVDLTLVIGLAILFTRGKSISATSETIQTTSIFTSLAALLPLILILDGQISRVDGIALIIFFLLYIVWLFSKKERFQQIYEEHKPEGIKIIKEVGLFIKNSGKVLLGVALLVGAAQGIVVSSSFFAEFWEVPILMIGLLIVGLGNALPETYFTIISARKNETTMLLGNLMGAVIVPSTLVLGIVAILTPIRIADFSPLAFARAFIVISVLLFFLFVKTGEKITLKEALVLLGVYLVFVASQIWIAY
ncbi:MAG: sodium:calcium antiporter [Candidatus Colwellbacteria bacterium]|nr:sodium:calcium antiporter [Candidatus Colwellbacteria bacterium]